MAVNDLDTQSMVKAVVDLEGMVRLSNQFSSLFMLLPR